MKKQIINVFKHIWLGLLCFCTNVVFAQNNSNWDFVGPVSTNLVDNDFETGRLEYLAVNPNNQNEIYTGGFHAGLWYTNDQGDNWTNINTQPIGTNGVSAITYFDDGTEKGVIAGNCHVVHSKKYEELYSTGVYRYNENNQGWTALSALPTNGHKIMIYDILVTGSNSRDYLVATSMGLFESNDAGVTWTLRLSESGIRNIIEVENPLNQQNECYLVGTKAEPQFTDIDRRSFKGVPVMYKRTNSGFYQELKIFFNFFNAKYDLTTYSYFTTRITEGKDLSNELELLGCCMFSINEFSTDIEDDPVNMDFQIPYRVRLHQNDISSMEVFDNGKIEYTSGSKDIDPNRLAIAYTPTPNDFWYGYVDIKVLRLNMVSLTSLMTGGSVLINPGRSHDDHKDFYYSSQNGVLYTVGDGGFNINKLLNGTLTESNNFIHKNNGLNVSLINGFSGYSDSPDRYLVGLQDIVHTQIIDEDLQKPQIVHYTWENDGGIVDKFNNNWVILDHESYSTSYFISENGGESISNSILTGGIYGNISEDHKASFGDNPYFQNPYNERLYAMFVAKTMISEFDFTEKRFRMKVNFANCPYFNAAGDMLYYRQVIDMSFSPLDKNSVFLVTNRHGMDAKGSAVIQYIGKNFDNAHKDNGTHYYYTEGGVQKRQWANVSPDVIGNSNMSGSFNALTLTESNAFELKSICQSLDTPGKVFVAVAAYPKNESVKALKYENGVWTDYSTGIPSDEVVMKMVLEEESNDRMYLSTHLSMYYRDKNMSSWQKYDNGYPSAYCKQMEINYTDRTVRSATYGRGIWKSQLVCPMDPNVVDSDTYNSGYQGEEGRFIASTGTVNSNAYLYYKAGQGIDLKPGFKATSGSKFHGFVQPCSSQKTRNETASFIQEEAKQNTVPLRLEDLQLSPNPANGVLNVLIPVDNAQMIIIFDNYGKLISSEKTNGNYHQVSTESLPEGFYFLTVVAEDGTRMSKRFAIVH